MGYVADPAVCNACPVKAACTPGTTGRRVHRSLHEPYLERVRAYHATESFEKAMRKRAVWIEPLFGEAKQWHGLRQFRLRGLMKVNTESLLTAAGQNLKRWLVATGWGRRHAPCGALPLPTRPHRTAAGRCPRRPRGGGPDPRPAHDGSPVTRGLRHRAGAWPFNPTCPCGRCGWRRPAVSGQDRDGTGTPPRRVSLERNRRGRRPPTGGPECRAAGGVLQRGHAAVRPRVRYKTPRRHQVGGRDQACFPGSPCLQAAARPARG